MVEIDPSALRTFGRVRMSMLPALMSPRVGTSRSPRGPAIVV
jgi:hypothetical protein